MKVLYTNKGLMTESEYLDTKKHDKNIVSYGSAVGGPEPTFDFAKHVIIKEELQHSQAGFVDTVPAVVSEDEIEEKACLDEIDLSELDDTQVSEGKATYWEARKSKPRKPRKPSGGNGVAKAVIAKTKEVFPHSGVGKKLRAAKEKLGQSLAGREMLKQFKIVDDDDRDRLERPGTDREIEVVDHVKTLEDALDKQNRGIIKKYDAQSAKQFDSKAQGAVAVTAKDDQHVVEIAKELEKTTGYDLKVMRASFKNFNKPAYALVIVDSDEILDESLEEKAPPGMEDMVMALKKKFGEDSPRPFQIAWSAYNKKKKKMKEGYGSKGVKEVASNPHTHKWSVKKWHPNYTVYSCSECGKEFVQKNRYRKDTDDEYDAQKDYEAMYGSRLIKEMVSSIVKEELTKEAYDRFEDGYRASLTWGQFPPDEILEKALEDGFTMKLRGRDAKVFDEAMEMRGIEPRMALSMMQDVDGFKQVLDALMEYSMQPAELELDADDETSDEIREKADVAGMIASGIMDVIGIEWI